MALGDPKLRRQAARELTCLLERHQEFSFLRLGDGEIQCVLHVNAGKAPPRYAYRDNELVSVERVYSVSGIEPRHFPRLFESLNNSTYLDHCDNLETNKKYLPTLGLQRAPGGYRNASQETANIIFDWAYYELKGYLRDHRCLFASAEAALMHELTSDPRYLEIAQEFWPKDANVFFHQVRENGRRFSENLDLIKEDLRNCIVEHQVDTLFLSLATGAKILCYELAKELGIRAIDFGSITRALTYAASPGYQANRSYHNPFMFRVPLDVFMCALEKAHPETDICTLIAKAQAQLTLDLQRLRPLQFNPTDACRGGQLEITGETLQIFKANKRYYNSHYLKLARRSEKGRELASGFRYWCWKIGIGWSGKAFLLLVKIKSLMRYGASFFRHSISVAAVESAPKRID
jgi:hypothetical protein